MSITPILAENETKFRSYLKEHKLNSRHFSYIATSENLRGYRGLIITVGRWWRNPRYDNPRFYEFINSLTYGGRVSIIQGTWDYDESHDLIHKGSF